MTLLLPLLLALAAPPARAQEPAAPADPDLAAEADLHFGLGVDAYRAGLYTQALEHLLLSNRLAPNRNVVFNVARCYELLGDWSQAFRHYGDYVAAEPDPALRQGGLDALERLRPRLALVRIESDPPGATVYVDRTDLGARGRTPLLLAVEPGAHDIIVQTDGYEQAITRAQATTGQEALARLALDPVLGRVALVGSPAGAQVRREGGDEVLAVLGEGTPVRLDLPPGPQVLQIEAEGFRPRRELVTVSRDQEVALTVALAPLTGTVVVEAAERGARIEVDGQAVGFTPAVLDLPAGPHQLVVTLPGYQPWTRELTVQADASTTVDVRLLSRQEVTAASRTTQDVERAPASVTLVDAREIRAFGHTTVWDALAGTRGLFQADDLTYQSLGFRGFARPGDYGNRVLVTVDGHVMNDDQLGGSYVAEDLLVDLGDVERIEVVRGPGSVLYGSNAFFGVVNVVTRRPEQAGAHVALTADGSRTARARGAVDLGDARRGAWLSAAALGSQGDDLELAALAGTETADGRLDGRIDGADGTRAATVHGRGWWESVQVQALFTARDKRIPTGAFGTVPGDDRAHAEDRRAFGEARWEPTLGDRGRLFTRAWLDHYAYDGAFPYDDSYVYRDRWRGLWVGAEPRLELRPVDPLTLTVGAEARHHLQAELTSQDTDGVVLDEDPLHSVLAANAAAAFEPAAWLRADLGARYDHTTLQGVGGALSPRLALVLVPREGTTLKLLGGTAFRAPSPYEFFYSDGGLTQVPPEQLDPERIATAEVEASQRLDDATTLTVGSYVNRITDLVGTELTGQVGEEGEIFRYANTDGQVWAAGLEAALRREWRRGTHLHVQQALQTARQEDLIGGEVLSHAPAWTGSVKAAVPLLSTGATLASLLRAESPRWLRGAGRDPQLDRTDWVLLWDLTATGQVGDGPVSLGAGVRNLLDWQVAWPVGVDLVPQTLPQPGRTFYATVRVDG